MAENQSPTPANTQEHGKSEPILSEEQRQQQDKVELPRSPEKKDEPEGTPEKKS